MKKRLQGLAAGLVAGVLLTTGVTYAANTTTLYDVMTNGIKIVLDGKELHPTDANGNKVEPFIYNGTTYLPVRSVATAMGKAVYWDGPEFTVYLGKCDPPLEYPTVELEDMVSINEEPRTTNELTDNYGNTYERAIINFACDEFEYLLNMKYSRFKATLYVPEGTNGGEDGYLIVKADGKTIYKSPTMDKTSRPVDIDVDVTGYNDVAIEFNGIYNSGDFVVPMCLGDAGFYQ